jgi:hypothetical protein
MTIKSLQFTRKSLGDGATETLSIVRAEADGALYVQIEAGTPADLGDYVGLYTLDGDQVSHTVGSFALVPGDRLSAGDEANRIAAERAEAANQAAGTSLTAADYLAIDGSLPFANIFADWEHGGTSVEAWDPA